MLLAPAMNQQMWRSAATQENLQRLRERGLRIVGPAEGEQACGDVGPGRLIEPPAIVDAAAACFASRALDGRRVVVTAGPTREPLDPVRFLSNHSSGRMGFAIARAAAEAGAATTLVAGPVDLATPERVARRDVTTAREMLDTCEALAPDCDVFIACAAVADYRPVTVAANKIKKSTERLHLELERNPDIVASIAARPGRPFMVGFAAETESLREHARAKLDAKGLDLVLANDVSDPEIGFNSEQNAGWLLWKDGERELRRCSKDTLAGLLIGEIARRLSPSVGA
jgi:phosphopantothenoylcysteine decarboxylase/phosphopantothenate--cysteine ligase